jgi:hypothetical protein
MELNLILDWMELQLKVSYIPKLFSKHIGGQFFKL